MQINVMQPQSPWILYFDGATRETGGNPCGIGAVLKDSRGHTVLELKKLINSSDCTSVVAKYEALIAGLKKALSLGVEYMLVKGDSLLIHSQVVGQCSVDDDRLVEYHRQVMALSKDFHALFVERISKLENIRADRLANDAIDEELQVADSLSEFIHQHNRPQSHPLPKRHVQLEGENEVATKSGESSPSRRCPLCCKDKDSSKERNHSHHVQDAARSGRKPRCHRNSKKPPGISATLLQELDCLDENTPFCTDESSEENSLEPLEGNTSGSTGTGEEGGYLSCTDPRFPCISSTSEESLSGDDLSEADYERLVKTILKDSSKQIRGTRSWR